MECRIPSGGARKEREVDVCMTDHPLVALLVRALASRGRDQGAGERGGPPREGGETPPADRWGWCAGREDAAGRQCVPVSYEFGIPVTGPAAGAEARAPRWQYLRSRARRWRAGGLGEVLLPRRGRAGAPLLCVAAAASSRGVGLFLGGDPSVRVAVRVVGAVAVVGPGAVAIGSVRLAVLGFLIRMRSSCGGMRVRGASGYGTRARRMGRLDVLLTISILKYRESRRCRQAIGRRIYARNTWPSGAPRTAFRAIAREPPRSVTRMCDGAHSRRPFCPVRPAGGTAGWCRRRRSRSAAGRRWRSTCR